MPYKPRGSYTESINRDTCKCHEKEVNVGLDAGLDLGLVSVLDVGLFYGLDEEQDVKLDKVLDHLFSVLESRSTCSSRIRH